MLQPNPAPSDYGPFSGQPPPPRFPPRQQPQPTSIWERVRQEQQRDSELDLATHNTKLRVAWRLTRALAILQKRIGHGHRIGDVEDPYAPKQAAAPAGTTGPKIYLKSIKLLPLPQSHHRRPQEISAEWAQQMAELARWLQADTVLPKDPLTTSEHLWGLFHPDPDLRAPWPSLEELHDYETRLIHHVVMPLLTRYGVLTVRKKLAKRYLLREVEEITPLISLARTASREIVEYDQEEERSMMVLRMQRIQEQARKSFNLREEMNAMRGEIQVRGLSKTQPSDLMDAFARVIASGTPTDALDLTKPQVRALLDSSAQAGDDPGEPPDDDDQ